MQLKDIKAGEHTFSVVMPTTREGFRIQAKLMNIAALTYQGKLQGDEQYDLLKSMLNGAEVDNQPLDFDKFFEGQIDLADTVFFAYVKEMYPSFLGKATAMFRRKMAENSVSAES